MRKILVVEDEDILRKVYHAILSTEPYDIDVAKNGKEALLKCVDTTYDLILLDLMMPEINGVQFLTKFRIDDNPYTKVIITSNLSASEMLNQAMKLGAHKSILKSDLSPKDLLALVRYEVEAT